MDTDEYSAESDDPRFWWDTLADGADADIVTSMDGGELVAVVSRDDGGVIAYAIGEKHAQRIITALLAVTSDR